MFSAFPEYREVIITQPIMNLARFVHGKVRLTDHVSRDSFGTLIANQCSLLVEVKA
jgi:hypothetical protein